MAQPKRIYITAPSLDAARNVSGISSVVRGIIDSCPNLQFSHIPAGRPDGGGPLQSIWGAVILILRISLILIRERRPIIHINTALNPLSIVRDSTLIFLCAQGGARTILHLHGGRFMTEGFGSSIVMRRITKAMLFRADVAIVLSEKERVIVESLCGRSDIKVLPNAVRPPGALSPPRDPYTIIWLGRLHESKGTDVLIQAATSAGLPGIRIECYGDGPQREKFCAEMKIAMGDSFRYGGVISGKQKEEALLRAGVYVLPSIYGEGLPMAMLEAMAAGCVVVASDIGSIGQVIKHEKNGLLVQPGDPMVLAEALKLATTIDRKDALRREAMATIKSDYSLDGYAQKLQGIYRELEHAES